MNDPRAFADRIDWGKVTAVRGRTINVVVTHQGEGPTPDDPVVMPQGRPDDPVAEWPRPDPGPATDPDSIAQILEDLNSPDSARRKRALGRLARHSRRRPGRGRRGNRASAGRSGRVHAADAARALATWGGPENTPALVEALKDPAFNVRWAAIDALRELGDPGSAPGLAALLATRDRAKACEALKAIGPEAEESVLPYLRHEDGFVRMETCKVLQAIGTERSVPGLRAIASKNSGLDGMAARQALDQISRRGAPIGDGPFATGARGR